MFNLIKKATTGGHKVQQDAETLFEDFSEEYQRQLDRAKEEESIRLNEKQAWEQEGDERELDDLDLETLRQEKRKLLLEIKRIEQEAEDIIAQAENSAKDMELEAKKKGKAEGYEKGHSQGSEKGYREALEEGLRQIKREHESVLLDLKESLSQMEEEKEKILVKYQEDLKDLAIAVAEKVVHVSLKSSGDIIKRMILSATEGMTDLKWAKIYIAETDSQQMVKGDSKLIDEISQLSSNIKVIVMPEEESGTCIIELPDKVLDASARTQIENIRDILSSARR